jgi:hypothetical protein
VSSLRSRRGRLVLGVALVLALFLVRPGATRLKLRIAHAIGMALQRQVEIGRVRLHLLPRPGFDLQNFVVHDDPAYSAEPILRAEEVTAFLRISSLMRGHLEISRLSLTEPSLNLARDGNGHWNIETLLEQTAKTAVAPTGKAPSESRPGFPYIEADRGRINFKFGPEKKPFTLTDADYAFWQDSENAWGMRLKARPMRTDFNLSDTGQVKVTGTWQRAATLRETPVAFNLQWDDAQLGQLTKLLSGQDRGWRGTVRVAAALVGTPADLVVRGDGSLEDFRRYDIAGGGLLELNSHCDAHYSSLDRSFHQILCRTPIQDGAIALQGEITNLPGPRRYVLDVTARGVPVQAVLAVVRHAKKNLPEDLLASGWVEADFRLRADGVGPWAFDGGGKTSDFRLQSAATKTELALNDLPFQLRSGAPEKPAQKGHGSGDNPSLLEPNAPRLTLGPIALKLGRPAPGTLAAWISNAGYGISVVGDADVQHLLQLAQLAGVPALRPTAHGTAKVDLQIAGQWSGFAGPKTTGTAQLRSVRAEVRGLNGPIEIASANLTLNADGTTVEAISALVAGSHWTGSLSLPRLCSSTQSCLLSFDLHADEIATDQLNEWLNPNPPKRPWYRFLSPASQSAGPAFLAKARATGKLAANRVVIRNLVGTRVTANVELDEGQLRVSDLRGEVIGGKHHGEWRADFTAKPPTYSGAGTLESVSLGQVAEAMHDPWISGTVSAKYKIDMTGLASGELAGSAKGSVQFNMRDGSLPHIALASGPLRVRRFTGLLALHDGQVEIQEGVLDSPSASFAVTGKASLSRKLDFKLAQEGSAPWSVTGTLAEPRVALANRAETRAALKPSLFVQRNPPGAR